LSVQRQILRITLERFPQSPKVWDQALTYGHYNLHDMTLIRQPHSLRRMDDDDNDDRDGKTSHYEYCRARGCICIAAAPLSMGLLTPTSSPPHWHPASSALRQACERAARICDAHKVDLAQLAILVAMGETKIPVTILGMKDTGQVQTVQRLCQRLRVANFDLDKALTREEWTVWKQIQDTEHGPFAQVWKTGDYHWDGISQVREFWQKLPGKPVVEEWQESS